MPSRRRTRRTRSLSRVDSATRALQKSRLTRRNLLRLDSAVLSVASTKDRVRAKNPASKASAVSVTRSSVSAEQKTVNLPIAEITSIPNPTPGTVTNVTAVGAGFPLLGAIPSETASLFSAIPATRSTLLAKAISTTSFSALPPLLSFAPTPNMTTAQYTRVSFPTPTAVPSSTAAAGPDLKSHQIAVSVTILLSVGSGLLLLGICIVIKMCTRPRRNQRPVPSLPVMKDLEADDDFFETKEEESPIFGGAERMSSTVGNGGPIWTWVQYPQNNKAQNTGPSVQTASQENHASTYYATQYPLPAQSFPTATVQMTETSSAQQALQYLPAAVTSASKRLSSTAALYNPPTPESSNTSDPRETALPADGYDVIKRSKPKSANRRSRQPEEKRYRDSMHSFVGLAYDTPKVVPPDPVNYVQPLETPAVDTTFEGRARVRSGYFAAGTYPRISTLPSATYSIATATRINVGQRNSFSKDKFSLQRSNSKRVRDTQALTYALGLASPRSEYGGLSPQPTLCPDDSLSVVDTRRVKKRNVLEKRPTEAVPDVPVISPTQETGRGASNLMGMDFGISQMSLSALALDQVSEVPIRIGNTDKPPRVPSPPALPSLTQMGLAQHNPEAYANYRSPTYSLYGMYEGFDRKSVVR